MGSVYQGFITDEAGNVMPNASILVRDEVTSAVIALFSDPGLSVGISNPTESDEDGFFQFYAAAGTYRIDATSGSLTRTFRHVQLGTAQSHDAGIVTGDDLPTLDEADARYITEDILNTRLGTVDNLGTMAQEDADDYLTQAEVDALFDALGTASEYDVGSDFDDVPTNSIIDERLGTYGNLGSIATQDHTDVDIQGGDIANVSITDSVAHLDSLVVSGDTSLGNDPASTADESSLKVPHVASAVNHIQIRGAVTTSPPQINALGTDTNIDIRVSPKGTGNVNVVGTTTTGIKVDGLVNIQNGAIPGLKVGADGLALTLTNATTKFSYLTLPHYTNAEEEILIFGISSQNANTLMRFGGGSASHNAATQIIFSTAATTTTLTGTEAFRVNASQQVLIGTSTAGASKLRVNDSSIEIMSANTPATAGATGTQGQFCWDANYLYICTAANTWRRVAHATW